MLIEWGQHKICQAPLPCSCLLIVAGTKVWDAQTFMPGNSGNSSNTVTDAKAFIQAETVMQLHQDTGKVLTEWGKGKFLMPHGLTVDTEGNVWVTDVGLHQAFKYSPKGKELLVLGEALVPGNGETQFCKPTHVSCQPAAHDDAYS